MEKAKKEVDSAQVDYLTGNLNRRGLYDYFETLPDESAISFMFLDIDNFKSVNDTYGHAEGDKLLVAVSEMMKSRIGHSVLARIGGDEFVIVPTVGLPERAVVGMAESIINSVNDIDISIEIKSIISFSVGIVTNQRKSMGMDIIMPKCDAAMYEAKRRGKNGYVLYSTIEDLFELKQVVDREKNQALRDGKFEVYYIPVMNINSSTMVAAKLYLVWNRKDKVWREEEFKEIIEDDSFMQELEKYAFAKVCEMISKRKDIKFRQIPVIFTVAGSNVNRVNFAEELLKAVRSFGISPNNFIIQLDHVNDRTDTRRVAAFFQALKEVGFGTAIKGFGADTASIIMIKELKVDYVAIGKDVVDNLLKERREALFVKNILSLINDLNFEPIIEGIEAEMQMRYLVSYNCNLGSGTYFADALDEVAYKQFAAENVPDTKQSIRFEFRNNLLDVTGKYEGKFVGSGKEKFIYDAALKKQVLYLQGGSQLNGVIELPAELMNHSSYSVAVKFKMSDFNNWSSVLYVLYKNGFMSFMPFAWNGMSMFRMKDEMDEDGWYDVIGNKVDKEWHTVILTYNHKNTTSRFYMDGKSMGFKDNNVVLSEPRRLILGGDIYVDSCVGYIDYVQFYDCVLDPKEIDKIFEESE